MQIQIFVGQKGPSRWEWIGYGVGLLVSIVLLLSGSFLLLKDDHIQVTLREIPQEIPSRSASPVVNPVPTSHAIEIDYRTECDKIRHQIVENYAIDVLFDEQVSALSIDGIAPIPYTDFEALYHDLSTFQETIGQYPRAFWEQLTHKLDLRFYFAQSIPNKSIAGVTMHDESNRLSIVFTSLGDLALTIHHEMGHTIYYFIEKAGTFQVPFPNWTQYNEGVTTRTLDEYFVDRYALKNRKEDIASTFAYVLSGFTWDSSTPLGEKILYMKQEIHQALPSLFV